MQAEAARWSVEVAGRRQCRPLDGAAPAAVFAAVEAAALRPLPAEPFVLATWATAKIGPDIHAQVGKVLYSVPWRHIGKTADVRVTATMVQFFIGGQLVKTHPRKARGKQTDFGDYPPEKIAFHMRTPAWCRRQAAAVGPACEQVIAELLADNALYRLRAAQGVIGLADRHDPSRLEAACAKAITAGDPSYRTVKGILAAGTDRDQLPAAAGDGGAGGVPARARVVRERHPHARHDHQRRLAPPRGARHDRRQPRAAALAAQAACPRRRRVRAGRDPRAALTIDDEITIQVPTWRRRRRTARSPAGATGAAGGTGPADPGWITADGTSPGTRAHLHRDRGNTMTTATVTDRSAWPRAAHLKLSGMLATLDARLAQAHAGELGHLDFLQVLCQDEISRREPVPASGSAAPGSRPRPPSRASTSAPPRSCPPRRSATSPPCAGCPPANRSSSTGRSGSARAMSPRPSPTSRSAPAPTPGS